MRTCLRLLRNGCRWCRVQCRYRRGGSVSRLLRNGCRWWRVQCRYRRGGSVSRLWQTASGACSAGGSGAVLRGDPVQQSRQPAQICHSSERGAARDQWKCTACHHTSQLGRLSAADHSNTTCPRHSAGSKPGSTTPSQISANILAKGYQIAKRTL